MTSSTLCAQQHLTEPAPWEEGACFRGEHSWSCSTPHPARSNPDTRDRRAGMRLGHCSPHLLPGAGTRLGTLQPFDTPITQLPEPPSPFSFEKQPRSIFKVPHFSSHHSQDKSPTMLPWHWHDPGEDSSRGQPVLPLSTLCWETRPCFALPSVALHLSPDGSPKTHMVQLTATSSSCVTFVRTLNSCIRITGRN